MKRMADEIEKCTKGHEDLERQLKAWVSQVKDFGTALQRAQSKLELQCLESSPNSDCY
jgi:hypothetical protein